MLNRDPEVRDFLLGLKPEFLRGEMGQGEKQDGAERKGEVNVFSGS